MLKTVTPLPLHFGTGISPVKMADKFEILSLNRNDLNEGFDGTGPGIRLRFSQLRNCLNGNSIIGN